LPSNYRGIFIEPLPRNYKGIFTEPLPSNDRGIHIQMGGFYYAVEMGSDAVIYVPSFINIGSGIQMLIGGIHRQQGDLISLLYFFK
jgi:hypothetical protein